MFSIVKRRTNFERKLPKEFVVMTINKILLSISGLLTIALLTKVVGYELNLNQRFENVRFETYKKIDGELQLEGYGDLLHC